MNKRTIETNNILTKILFMMASVYMSNEEGEDSDNFFLEKKRLGKFGLFSTIGLHNVSI